MFWEFLPLKQYKMRCSFIFKKITEIFFYGNFFTGICAVSLCIETNMQLHLPIKNLLFYILIFLGTILYYNFIYLKSPTQIILNERETWYNKNQNVMKKIQKIVFFFFILNLLFILINNYRNSTFLSILDFLFIFLIISVVIIYSFNILPFKHTKQLREIGWLKPFVVGFAWSGIVTYYPIIFYHLQYPNNERVSLKLSSIFWFINMFFISILCIMFDLKDYKEDKTHNINTFAVQIGIKNTINFIIIPLIILGNFISLIFALTLSIKIIYIIFNIIPCVFLFLISFKLYKKRSIIFYLFIIDGMMILKSICGICGIMF